MDFSKVHQFDARQPGKILCIHGRSGAGKSYMARQLRNQYDVVIDGDAFRHYVTPELTFSEKDRRINNEMAARVAELLARQGLSVIIATIRADIAYEILTEKGLHAEKIHVNYKPQ